MAFEPFSIDITVDTSGQPTGYMVHVRADTADKWRTNLHAAADILPAVKLALDQAGGIYPPMSARVAHERNEQAREQVRAATAAVVERRAEQRNTEPRAATRGVEPLVDEPSLVCPDHAKGMSSQFFTGLYCPSTLATGKRCSWKHECNEQPRPCSHPLPEPKRRSA